MSVGVASRPHRAATVWTVVAGAVALAASAGGLLLKDAYAADAATTEMLRGYDLVTATVAVPVLAVALEFAQRGAVAARIVVVSMLAYLVYADAYYLFGTGFHDLFLLHAAVMACGLLALRWQVTALDLGAVRPLIPSRRRRRGAAVVLGLLALALGGMWVAVAVANVVTGDVPEGSVLVETDTVVHLGMALDLSLLVPLYAASAVGLWRGTAAGHVLGMVSLVAGVLHQVGYVVALRFQVAAEVPGAQGWDPGEPFVVAAYLLGLALLAPRGGLSPVGQGRRPMNASRSVCGSEPAGTSTRGP